MLMVVDTAEVDLRLVVVVVVVVEDRMLDVAVVGTTEVDRELDAAVVAVPRTHCQSEERLENIMSYIMYIRVHIQNNTSTDIQKAF